MIGLSKTLVEVVNEASRLRLGSVTVGGNPMSSSFRSRGYFFNVAFAMTLFSATLSAFAATNNPIPQVVGPPVPQAVVPGSRTFTLTVYGANFVQGATVNWNRQPRTTTFVSARELQAQILASDIAKPTAGYVTVTNPPPGGGVSSSSYGLVEVHKPTKTIVVGSPNVYLQGIGSEISLLSDFNNDGILDFAASYGGSEIIVFQGAGDGTFGHSSIAAHNYYGDGPGVIAGGDFNNDGNEDLVFGANVNEPTKLQVALGKGSGKFTKGSRFWHYQTYAFGIASGDFNQDGTLDLSTVTSCCTLSVFLGQGDGSFKHRANYDELGPSEVRTADFDGDGILDLAVLRPSGNGGVHIRLGNGDGTFSKSRVVDPHAGLGCSFGPALYVTDFNGDGKADLAYCERDDPDNKGIIWMALGNGDGTFQKPTSLTVHADHGVFTFAVGDFNSDGKTDLIANYFKANNFNETETDLFLGNGDGTFQKKKIIKLPGLPFYNAENGFELADFNSDGLLDFIVKQPGEFDVFMQK
jgi:FG-GAP-like repeat